MNIYSVLNWSVILISLLTFGSTLFFHYYRWLENGQLNKSINVKIVNTDKIFDLPGELRRADLARAELLGYIGMVPMKEKGKRFSINYVNTPEFFQELRKAQTSKGNYTIDILCTNDEYDQFDFVALKQQGSK